MPTTTEVPLGVMMNRTEAERYMLALNQQRTSLVDTMKAIRRKRGWRDSEKAMALGDYQTRWDTITALYAKIGETFNLGGH